MRGFTLIELLVAIFIVAILGTTATALLLSTLDNREQMTERSTALEQLGMSFALMRRDLEQIAPRYGRDRYGDPREHILGVIHEGDHSLLEFTRDGRRTFPGRSPGSSLERVRYEVEEGRLIRYSAPVPDPVAHTDWQQQILMEDVRRLDFRYYDGDQWHEVWPPATGTAPEVPVAVSIELDAGFWEELRLQVLLPESVGAAG